MKPTFNQVISGIFALLCLVALVFMYFVNSIVPESVKGGIVVAFVVAFKDFANAFVKSSSDNQHAAQTEQLINAVSNSSPMPIIPPIVNRLANIPPILNSPLTIEQLIAACKDLPSLEALLPKVQINGIPQTVTDLYNAKKIELTK